MSFSLPLHTQSQQYMAHYKRSITMFQLNKFKKYIPSSAHMSDSTLRIIGDTLKQVTGEGVCVNPAVALINMNKTCTENATHTCRVGF